MVVINPISHSESAYRWRFEKNYLINIGFRTRLRLKKILLTLEYIKEMWNASIIHSYDLNLFMQYESKTICTFSYFAKLFYHAGIFGHKLRSCKSNMERNFHLANYCFLIKYLKRQIISPLWIFYFLSQ